MPKRKASRKPKAKAAVVVVPVEHLNAFEQMLKDMKDWYDGLGKPKAK